MDNLEGSSGTTIQPTKELSTKIVSREMKLAGTPEKSLYCVAVVQDVLLFSFICSGNFLCIESVRR